MEHSALSLGDTQLALQVLGDDIIKFVRVPGNDDIWIKRILDTGCDGIIVPMVNSADEAERVVWSSKYPPAGHRSVGAARAHKYGASFNEYVAEANRRIVLMIQIEHIEAVKNIDSILNVKGIDSVFIGPYDLSASIGLTGQVSHPEVRSAVNLIKGKCREKGLPYGIFGTEPASLREEIKDGCTYVLCGVDLTILQNSYRRILESLSSQEPVNF